MTPETTTLNARHESQGAFAPKTELAGAFERLKATSFYYRQGLLDTLLSQAEKRSEK